MFDDGPEDLGESRPLLVGVDDAVLGDGVSRHRYRQAGLSDDVGADVAEHSCHRRVGARPAPSAATLIHATGLP